MHDQVPPHQEPDQLYLVGLLQIDTAINALTMTNPEAADRMRALRDLQAQVAADGDRVAIFLDGTDAEEIKGDVIVGAEMNEVNAGLSTDERAAANGLLAQLRGTKQK